MPRKWTDEERKAASERTKARLAAKKAGTVDIKPPDDGIKKVPITVIYFSENAGHTLSIPNTEKRSIDGKITGEKSIKFSGHLYTSQSMAERTLLENSQPWISGTIEIHTPDVDPLYPDQKRAKPPRIRVDMNKMRVIGRVGV